MVRMLRTLPFALALAALSLFTAGCGSGSGTKFRLVNAIADVPGNQGIDVYIDGKNVETVQFATAPSGYLSVSSGSRHVQLFLTGTTAAPYFDDPNMSFNAGTAYTLVATGSVTDNTIVMPQFTDNNPVPTSGNAALRIIQASLAGLGGNSAVDIYIVGPGGGLPGTTPDIPDVVYPAASAYKTLPAGTYDLLLTPAGIASLNIRMAGASFSSANSYTYVLVDVQGGGEMSSTPVPLTDNQ